MASTIGFVFKPFEKPAETSAEIHPLLRHRWSPRAFAPTPVSQEQLRSLFEAARWAPSSSNEQPWRFIVSSKENQQAFGLILSTLVEFNQAWAGHAPVIGIAAAKLAMNDGRPNHWAFHDVGLALGMFAIEAEALGLHVHFMAGFDREAARAVLEIPEGYDAITAFALGHPGDPQTLPDKLRDRELAPRTRKPLSEIVFHGLWNRPQFPE